MARVPLAWERGEVPGIGRDRSAEDTRLVIATGGTTTWPPRPALDTGELPGPLKKASGQRLYDVLVKYLEPVLRRRRREDVEPCVLAGP